MSTVTLGTPSGSDQSFGLGRLLRIGLVAGVAAAVVNLIIYFVGTTVFAVPFLITMQPGTAPIPLVVPAIIGMSILPGLLAALFLWGLARFVSRPIRWFQGISLVLLLLSLLPLSMPLDAATRVGLVLMHLATGLLIIAALSRAE